MLVALNFILFQAGWLMSVLGGANRLPLLGPLVTVCIIAWHLRVCRQPGPELLLITVCAVIGLAFDSMLVASGLVHYPSGMLAAGLAPYWIVTMWMLFATTINVSMTWLRGRTWLAVLLGGAGGPLSYIAGAQLDGIVLVDRTMAIIALGAGWAFLLPVLVALGERLENRAVRSAPLAGQAP